jgi:UDP-glucuronate 4-epimerase
MAVGEIAPFVAQRSRDHSYSRNVSRLLVTGAAGFIGSHVVEEAVRRGHEVVAVDDFDEFYDPARKRANAALVELRTGVATHDFDLLSGDVGSLLDGVTSIVHLAGRPGVRPSWDDFEAYLRGNVMVTERLLSEASDRGVRRFVLASSSSVYGDADSLPVTEDAVARPISPYGVTKLAAEHLVRSFSASTDMTTVSLRYFTVFGPRQRPDMAFARLIDSCLTGRPFRIFGDGRQERDFTYVDDVVDATLKSVEVDLDGDVVLNVCGGASVSLMDTVEMIETLTGRRAVVVPEGPARGDVRKTAGSSRRALEVLGWSPRTGLAEGLTRQIDEQARR